MNQLELHKRIEEFFKTGVDSADVGITKNLIINDDAKSFFFSQADDSWLTWLWEKGFLKEIEKKSEDTKYAYRLPELYYLTRMAEKKPAEVAQIINSVKVSEASFNPGVIDRFLWILNVLPPEQIKTLTAKIRDEKWIYLMRSFREGGYDFERIVKRLNEKKENEAILELAQALFTVKSKAEISEKGSSFSMDDPFYISDLDSSGIFGAVASVEEPHTEGALRIVTEAMARIIQLAEQDETKVFDYNDLFSLFDVDFFTLEIQDTKSISYREDVKNLAATIKKLIERTIGKNCNNADEAKRLFEHVNKLPSCRAIWRLRLFAIAQCPEVFKEELKDAFFKVFDVDERYFEIEGGAEYHQALIRGFKVLDESIQREYIKKVLNYFGADLGDKEKEEWRKRDALRIFSSIKEHLTPDEKKLAEQRFGVSLDEVNCVPEPIIGKTIAGSVNHKSPVNPADFTVDQIVTNLKSEWTPEKLNEQYKNDDFLNPRGVEGLGDALKEDIKKRPDEYLRKFEAFFDKDLIHPHYMYSLLRGIEEMLRNRQPLNPEQIGQVFRLFGIIMNDGKKTPFKRKDDKSWLADWIEVHKVITDILLFVLENKEVKEEIHKIHREQVKNLISYLLTIKDSPSKEHEKPEYGEPYHIAINSVRGRAYEVFVVFTENDGKTLAEDTKKIYRQALVDDSLAVRFVIGRYLASFYFRDKDFITSLFPEIFPKDDLGKKDIYLATWEGYLSNTLYDKLFIVLKDYYSYAITLDPKNYTQRKYLKGLDESLAIHLALAFAYLGLEIGDPLFVQFWSTASTTRHQEFISFIGRSCLTGDQAEGGRLEKSKVSKEKLIKFWDWALKNVSEPKALAGFGYWVKPDEEILDDNVVIEKITETLKKSDGNIDWDYGFLRRLPIFAEKNGGKTLEIISSYLLDSKNNLNSNRSTPLLYQAEIKDALKVIYENGDKAIKEKVTNLINTLIEKGSSAFWGLKEVISEDQEGQKKDNSE